MKFDKLALSYLDGAAFSSGYEIKVSEENEPLRDRVSIIIDKCRGKSVLHLGCADHIEIIDLKIKSGTWLHEILCKNSRRCYGIDNNEKALKYISEKYGYKDIICCDIISEECPIIRNSNWDYMVIGEMLEHVNSPFHFLKEIHDKYSKNINNLIITVPNAFALQNHIMAKKNVELINTDHRYWFTPYTLAKIAIEAGYEVDDFEFCMPTINNKFFRSCINPKNMHKKKMILHHPALRETLVMTLKNG